MNYFIEDSLNYAYNDINSIDTNIYIYFNESSSLYRSISTT